MASRVIRFSLSEKIVRNTFIAVVLLFLVSVFFFSVVYLCSSRQSLSGWYLGLTPYFYNKEQWLTAFFTPSVKRFGNIFCFAAVGISIVGVYKLYKVWQANSETVKDAYSFAVFMVDVFWIALLTATCIGLWSWGNAKFHPAFDEVFSAVNSAGSHPFVALSYYMLPNNHIGFNLFNGVFFYFAADKLITGRFLSFVAYLILVLSVFGWFCTFMRYRVLAFMGAIAVALQFSVWGYGFQNRGYEWYTLATFIAFISALYFTSTNNKRWLHLNTVACIVGNCCVPTFFYYQVAQWLFVGLLPGASSRRVFWWAQLTVLSIVFLFYLPALCFSGIGAFIANPYVSSAGNLAGIVGKSGAYLVEFATYCYSGMVSEYNFMNVLFFLLPLLLLFRWKRNVFFARAGVYFGVLWLMAFIVVFIMRRYPYLRNMAGHECISLTLFIVVVYWLTDRFAHRLKIRPAGFILFAAVAAGLSAHFIEVNSGRFQNLLYNYNTTEKYMAISEAVATLPATATLACTNESFYAYYLASKRGLKPTQHPTGKEQYLIKQADERVESGILAQYAYLFAFDSYQLYQKK